ncbi:hypothetical protein JYA35_15140 [Bacillus velezensis]|uniref:hypothetical protein n=1 Tax=Bacillus velezensis TaxID=492670 RepID=UPI0019D3A4D0|nr:hypothetical protein [Bacillus velezensis]MBN7743917.1 hypothetical protein [Bacillus velezensis]
MKRPKCYYEGELLEIEYILRNMENGRIYGLNGNSSRGDGDLPHNVNKLRDLIYDLIRKYEKDLPSDTDIAGAEIFGKNEES